MEEKKGYQMSWINIQRKKEKIAGKKREGPKGKREREKALW